MEFLTAITSFLSTAAGKVAAGTAIAAASAGGLHAADVVELPVLPDRGDETVVETDVDATETEGADAEAADTGTTDAEIETNDGLGVDGETVAEDAKDGGVEGQDVARDAIAGTPAEERVPAEFGPEAAPAEPADRGQAPEEAGSQDPSDRGTDTPAAEEADSDSDGPGASADPTDRGTVTPAPRP